jgi:hypothetical protein
LTYADDVVVLRAALRAALPHVHRQVTAGKHEQDRLDAQAFLRVYGTLACELREQAGESAPDGPGVEANA